MGLLDFLGTEEAKMGLGLLAASGPSTQPMNAFQRIQMAQQGMSADKAQALKLKMLQSQIEENESQAQLRAAQVAKQQNIQGLTAGMLGDMGGTSMGGGSNVSPGVPPQVAAGLRGIPIERVAALKAAGGPDLVEAWKAVNVPTSLAAGSYAFTPGQAPTYMADPSKGFGVGPQGVYTLPGANEAHAGIEGAKEEAKARAQARFQEATPTIATDGSKTIRSRLEQYGGGPVNGQPIKNPMAARPEDTDRAMIFTQELREAQGRLKQAALSGDAASIERARSDIAGIEREIKTNRIQMPAGNVVELSPQQQAANKASEASAVDTAKAGVVRDTETQKKAKSAGTMIAAADRAIDLLKQGPTASGVGEVVDKTANFFGKSPKGAQISSQLDIVAGELVNNVPRMEGPQSNADMIEYRTQAGKAADRTVPIPQRLAAMEEVKRLQTKYAGLNGGTGNTGGASGSFDDKPAAKLKTAPSEADIRNTALKYGMTPEQVKKKLGIE